jgi:PAS domain S-box-containing protein
VSDAVGHHAGGGDRDGPDAFLVRLADALRPLADPVAIQAEAARAVGRHLGASRASYAEVAADDAHFVVRRDYADGVPSYAGRYLLDSFGPGFVEDLRAGRTVTLADAERDPRVGGAERAVLAAGTIRAFVGVPLVKGGRLAAVFSLHFPAPHRWTADEVRLVEEVAGRTWDAVERARAEAALRASEGRFRAVAANLPGAAVFVVGPDLRYELAEGQALRDAGFAPADFEGKTVAEAVGPDLAPGYEGNYRKALAGGSFAWEHPAHGRHFVSHLAPLRDPAGAVTAALAVSYDITDRVRAEEAVRASEERFRLLVESVRDHAIFALDPDGTVMSWNPAAGRVFGYAAGEVVGRSGDVFFTPEDRAAGLPERERATAAADGRAVDENWAVRKGGSRFWASGTSSAVRDPGGRLTGFVKVVRDRTEARQAEEAVRRAEERLRLALAAARMGIWTWDLTTGTHARDANLNRLLGLPAEEAAQPLDGFLAHVHPDDRGEVRRAFDFSSEFGHPLSLEFRVVWPDGTVRWLRDQGDVFGREDGGPGYMTGACVDITERKEAEAALRRARDELEDRVRGRTAELEEANAARTDLLRRLGQAQEGERQRIARDLHDSLGQLVAALALGLRAAEAEAGPDSPAAARLKKLGDLTQEVGRETHRLAVELRPTALDDAGLAAALRAYVEAWSDRTGIPAEFSAAGPDGERFPAEVGTTVYRVVQEALTNVLRHAGASRVSVLLERWDGRLTAIVEDDGAGFDPARAIGTPRAVGGLGLIGMRERAALVGGSLDIESTPGGGTTVYVRVPARAGT